MKIVYFGSDVFLQSFLYLAEHHTILALFTYHNDEDFFHEYTVVRHARRLGIPVYYRGITEEEVRDYFLNQGCDLFIVAEYNRILPVPQGLEAFRGVNIHSSCLPQGRSYYPIECAMERGLKETGVTMHIVRTQLDMGEILFQEKIPVRDDMDSVDVYIESGKRTLEMVKALTSDLEGCWQRARAQKEVLPYWKRPDQAKMTLSHHMTTAQAMDIFRRYNQMTQAVLSWCTGWVCAMMPGRAHIGQDEIILSDRACLYRTADGHVRLIVEPIEGSREI